MTTAGEAKVAGSAKVVAVVAAPVRWLLRSRDPAERRWGEVVVDAVLAGTAVPVPPTRVLAAWVAAVGEQEGASRLALLDELVTAAETRRAQGDGGARVHAADLPGLPVSLRAALAVLPARHPHRPATAGAAPSWAPRCRSPSRCRGWRR